MQQNLAVPGTLVLDAAAACGDVSRSPFGEECHLRVRGTDGAYSIVDYRAPAGFGPARHTHRREDEIIQLLEGRIAVWTQQRGFTMSPGDLVVSPKTASVTRTDALLISSRLRRFPPANRTTPDQVRRRISFENAICWHGCFRSP